MDQKKDYVARGIIHIGVISLHLAAFRTGLTRQARPELGCVGHSESENMDCDRIIAVNVLVSFCTNNA